jgi:hypothetical protein
VGDTRGLAGLLRRFEVDAAFRRTLTRQCRRLAPLADPAKERRSWQTLLERLGPRRASARAARSG